MIIKLLQLLPDSLVEWLALLLLLGLVAAAGLGWGWQAGQARERARSDDLARQLELTTRSLWQARQQASGLAEALAASQDNGADLMRRLLAAEALACLPETTADVPPAPAAAPRTGGDAAFTEAINAW